MLLILLYHGINHTKYGNNFKIFENHLEYLSNNFPIILPGENIKSPISICLTFDDSCFDMYHFVFPLLKKYKIKALLSIPALLIPEVVLSSTEKRLSAVDDFQNKMKSFISPFCSWEELKEMSEYGVKMASHGLTHSNLTTLKNPQEEITHSKKLIEEKLKIEIDSFVYPFGAWNKQIQNTLKDHYKFIFRIGTSCNFSWNPSSKLLYRISMDQLITPKERLNLFHLSKYYLSYPIKRLLGR